MNDYQIEKQIGTGAYGSVYLARHNQQKIDYVIKKMKMWDLKQQQRQKIDNQVKLLREFKHPNIVRYRDSFIDQKGYLNIVMTNCQGGDMYKLIQNMHGQKFQQKKIIDWAVQIALAIYYMHQKKILHRDLKNSNIFLNHGRIRLGDFGISKVLDQKQNFLAQTNIGTPLYMSPQQFRCKPYSYKSDIWAFGCVLYEMCNQKHAFNGLSLHGLARKIFLGEYTPVSEYYSHQLRDLIHKMLSQNHKGRPSIIQILQKPFMKRRVQAYIKQIINQKTYEPQVLGSLLQQAHSLGIQIQKNHTQSSNTKPRSNSKNSKIQQIQRQKRQQQLKAQLLKQSQQRKKMQQKLKQIERKRQALKKATKQKQKQYNSYQKNQNTPSLIDKKQSTKASVNSSRISQKQQTNKNKPKQQQNIQIVDRKKSFKMQQQHDMHYQQQSDQDDLLVAAIINQQPQQQQQQKQQIKISQQQQIIQQISNKKNKNIPLQIKQNQQQLIKQLKQKTHKIQLIQTQLQKIQLQFSSDSQKFQQIKKYNPKYTNLLEKINDFKYKIITILGRQNYSKFMKYIINHCGKQNKINKQQIENIIGKNRIGFWHIAQQIFILEKVLETIPQRIQ